MHNKLYVLIISVYIETKLKSIDLYTIRFACLWRVRKSLFHVCTAIGNVVWAFVYNVIEIKFTVIISLLIWPEEYRGSTIHILWDFPVHGEQIEPSSIFIAYSSHELWVIN